MVDKGSHTNASVLVSVQCVSRIAGTDVALYGLSAVVVTATIVHITLTGS